MAAGKPLRIAVIDDSVVVRRLVADALRGDPRIGEVRTAGDGRQGVELVREMTPDVVTMDVEMPVMDGIEATREIRTFDSRVPIIMFSTLTEAGARATLDAFAAGASDFCSKPGQARSIGASLVAVRAELIPKILALADPGAAARATTAEVLGRPTETSMSVRPRSGASVRPALDTGPVIVAIGSSTGGPEALSRLLSRLPADVTVPMVVTQHMPAMFTKLLAERLDKGSRPRVREAVDNAVLEPGTVTIAPGGHHLVVVGDGAVLRARLSDGPPVNSCKPSVDVMFDSVAAVAGPAAVAMVLTGMGSDGALGALAVASAGGRVWVQDEASSVVWGMPGATVAMGVVERVLPVDGLTDALVAVCRAGRDAPPPAPAVVSLAPGSRR